MITRIYKEIAAIFVGKQKLDTKEKANKNKC